VVEDNPERSFTLPEWVEHYSWREIDDHLGPEAWIIPRRSDCVRSFGFYLAYGSRAEYVLTLDDDCYPEQSYAMPFLDQFERALKRKWHDDRWWNTLSSVHPRGFPYEIRGRRLTTVSHHGLWSNVPDLDALTQARLPNFRTAPATRVSRVPFGRFFPMCGMNLAFRREMIPAMYFLLMGQNSQGAHWPYDRFGDIWAGVFAKKIGDHLGLVTSSGAPSVHHSRASNVDANLRKETPGYPMNELLWKAVGDVQLNGDSPVQCYRELAAKLSMPGEYWGVLRRAMTVWADLFGPGDALRTPIDADRVRD
jgi:hypothetical protein